VFHKYSLGGDIMTPSGLYARLCHAFSTLFLFLSYCFNCLHDMFLL